ncbi:zinc ribbon domain-containing protein [Candidatus Sumerlaeota bacterium]|nr:zinc ribbon domain-containing protein [Candidatus Sumerlaeota bacterium]
MPVYEYQCADCKHITEFLERFDNKEPHECEKCHSGKMSRILSRFGSVSGNSDGESFDGEDSSSGCSSCSLDNCSSCGI